MYCLRNPPGPEIRSVADEMSNMLEQCKEVVGEMTNKVAEFIETNMGIVEVAPCDSTALHAMASSMWGQRCDDGVPCRQRTTGAG